MSLHPNFERLRRYYPDQMSKPMWAWLRYIRYKWRDDLLIQQEIEILEALGIRKDKKQDKRPWVKWYNDLRDYQVTHQRISPLYTETEPDPELRRLGRWASKQRESYKDLSSMRRKMLEKLPLGFPLDLNHEKFYRNFVRLRNFAKKYGHLDIPNRGRYKDLYAWVNNVRHKFNNRNKSMYKNAYSSEQYAMLSALGIKWEGGFQTRMRRKRKEMNKRDQEVWMEEWKRHLNEIKTLRG